MKQIILILVCMLFATTVYNQTSRRTSSTNTTASRSSSKNSTDVSNRNSDHHSLNRQGSHRGTSINSRVNNNSRVHSSAKSSRVVHTNNNRRTTTSVNSTNSKHKVYASSRRYTGHHAANYVYYPKHSHRYIYRSPVYVDIIWTANMHRRYVKMYPTYRHWNYHYGYHIRNISAYHAYSYIGEVKSVYGKVTDIYYSRETDEYFLYIGPYYPYQNFTIVIPGHIARNRSHRPVRYFMSQHVAVTGLITIFEDKPEIVVKRNSQINIY